MKKKEISDFRELLSEKKRNILNKLIKDSNRFHESFKANGEGDLADIANDALEKYLLFDLSVGEKQELIDIENALKKIDNGSFGVCETCNKDIPRQRLQIQPFAKLCVGCQEKAESGK